MSGIRRPFAALLAASLVAACGGPAASPGGPSGSPPPASSAESLPSPTGTAATAPPAGPTAPGSAVPAAIPGGGTWARIEIGGSVPAAREDHTWTVDDAGAVAYLFGGRGNGETYDDLWAFDLAGETWRRVEPAGPGPKARFGHEAAWVPGRGLVITLGQAGSSFFDDVWLFDPGSSTWQQLPSAGAAPVARYGSCSGLGPDGRLWISHGFTQEGSRFFDTRAYDFGAMAWADLTPPDRRPVERCLHTCWWTADGQLTLYGGQTTGVAALGDLWRLTPGAAGSPGAWAKLADPSLAARQLPAVARRGSFAVVVGGRGIDGKPLADTWLLPDSAGPGVVSLRLDGPSPPARSGGALVDDAARDRMLLFGGIGDGGSGDGALGDLWSLTFD